MKRSVFPLLGCGLVTLFGSFGAQAGMLEIKDVRASSSYPSDSGAYEAKRIADGKISTAWVEGEEGSGLGSWVELDLGAEHNVEKIRVWGGIWFSSTEWNRSNRPKALELTFSDGSSEDHELGDEMKMHEVRLTKPRTTRTIKLKLKGSHSGSAWNDTGFSEVQVFDASAGSVAPLRGVDASSKLPPDADGNYEPINVADGITDTMWCEGAKEGDGTGESLTYQLAGATRVSSLHMVNGIGTSLKYWMKGNRATKARLAFSDGSTEEVEIKNSMLPQVITFPPRTTTRIDLTFTEVAKGKEYNDLCISEAYFE